VAVALFGGIYTAQSAPAPVLDVTHSGDNANISWIIPSTEFILQQNSDLTTDNWMDVTNAPVLNLTNLQNEVVVPVSINNQFYRLKGL